MLNAKGLNDTPDLTVLGQDQSHPLPVICDVGNDDNSSSGMGNDNSNENVLSNEEAAKATSLRYVYIGAVLCFLISITNQNRSSEYTGYMLFMVLVVNISKLVFAVGYIAFVCLHFYRHGIAYSRD